MSLPERGFSQVRFDAIIGKKGTGKDTLTQDFLQDYFDDGYNQVYSNLTIYHPHNTHTWNSLHSSTCDKYIDERVHRIKYLRQLRQAKNAPVVISELSKAIPSRKVGSHNTELYNLIQDTMNRLRKKGCPFIYSDQWRRGADIMIRTNVDHVWLPTLTQDMVEGRLASPDYKLGALTFIPKSTEFWEMENPQSAEMTAWTSHRTIGQLFNLFRTEEVIPLTYNPPFKVEAWSNSFTNWCTKHQYIIVGMREGTVRNILKLYMVKKNAYITGTELSAVLGKLKVDGKI